MKKLLSSILIITLAFSLLGCRPDIAGSDLNNSSPEDIQITVPEIPEDTQAILDNIVILYTNDVHCAVNDNLGYRTLGVMKESLESIGKDVILVDCGDSIQGSYIGSLTQGEAIINIMNSLEYDVMAIGNHEFDYGVDRLIELSSLASFDFVSCNFRDNTTGENIFKPYSLIDCNGVTIAFLGISTPETVTSSTPTYFQDSDGNYIYDFCGDDTGDLLASTVTAAAAAARSEGADYVVALSHLGIDASCSPYTTSELIPKISGVDAYLDGHSHSTVNNVVVTDADGIGVPVSQTGTGLTSIGMLTFTESGKFTTQLIDCNNTGSVIVNEEAALEATMDVVVGHTDFPLIINDPATDTRIVRLTETNLGDLATDAIRDYTGADIAIINDGGLRSDIPAGDITNRSIINVMPFNNEISMISCSGQQILDALEYSVSAYPAEFGGFLHVSGITFDVDVNIESGVVTDEIGMFVSVEGDARRVSNVMVNGEPIDPNRQYTLAGISYILLNSGDGYSMFSDCEVLLTSSIIDNQLFISYISDTLGGVIGEEYSDPYGQGRINFI